MNIDYNQMSTEGLNKTYRDALSKNNHGLVQLVADILRKRGIDVPDEPIINRGVDNDYLTDNLEDPIDHWYNQKK